MKKINITIILLGLFLNSFSQNIIHKPDTIKTLMLYAAPDKDQLQYELGYRIIKDILKFVKVDAITYKQKKTVDTSYFVPVLYQQKDSLNNPLFDKEGKPITSMAYVYIPPTSVFIDGNKNVDPIINKYYAKKPKK